MAPGPAITLMDTSPSTLRSLTLPRMILKSPAQPEAGLKLHLSALDQNIVRVYTQVFLVFPFPDHSKRSDAANALERGLRASLHSFPFLAGELSLADDDSGKLTLTYPAHVSDMEGMFAQKHNDTFHAYSDLKERGMPPDAFPGTRLRPADFSKYPGIPADGEGIVDFSNGNTAPVMRVQADFIPGGLILSTYVHHSVMDFAGINVFWKCFAENVSCRTLGATMACSSGKFDTKGPRRCVSANVHSNRLQP